jgi:hypothetical protein
MYDTSHHSIADVIPFYRSPTNTLHNISMYGICKHLLAQCMCGICWPHQAQCPTGIQCDEEIQQGLLDGHTYGLEGSYEDYEEPTTSQHFPTPPPSTSYPGIVTPPSPSLHYNNDSPLDKPNNSTRTLGHLHNSPKQNNHSITTTLHSDWLSTTNPITTNPIHNNHISQRTSPPRSSTRTNGRLDQPLSNSTTLCESQPTSTIVM